MPRSAGLFETAGGNVVRGYLLLKQGGGNVPPMWITRARESRKTREKNVVLALQKGRVTDIITLEDWNTAYSKESFYRGIRCLMELDRNGCTDL